MFAAAGISKQRQIALQAFAELCQLQSFLPLSFREVTKIQYLPMCGRYRRTTQEEELARIYHVPIPKQTDLPTSYNFAPSQKVLTIRFNPETQQRSLDALQWGLIPYWTKDPHPYASDPGRRALRG